MAAEYDVTFENVQPDDIFLDRVVVVRTRADLKFPCGHPNTPENRYLRSDRSVGYKCAECDKRRTKARRAAKLKENE